LIDFFSSTVEIENRALSDFNVVYTGLTSERRQHLKKDNTMRDMIRATAEEQKWLSDATGLPIADPACVQNMPAHKLAMHNAGDLEEDDEEIGPTTVTTGGALPPRPLQQ
jgi:hypothetical protein